MPVDKFMDVMFLLFFRLFWPVILIILAIGLSYTQPWKMLINLLLNKVINIFYHRITTDKSRPAVYKNHHHVFPWLRQLEENWKAIREELLSFMKNDTAMHNVHTTGGEELNKESNWKLAMVFGYGKTMNKIKNSFPLTLSILETLPDVQNAAFSLLKAGGSIPPHVGSTASILRYHLALIVPDHGENSWLTVDGVNFPWKEGQGILFDDTFEHSARNGTAEDRVVMIVDIFRPNLGLVEKLIQKIEIWKRTKDFYASRTG